MVRSKKSSQRTKKNRRIVPRKERAGLRVKTGVMAGADVCTTVTRTDVGY